MIPKEIAFQLVELKEKSKTYSAIQRSYKIDEIRADVTRINNEITGLTRNVNNTLTDGLISKFEIDNWFAGLKDKSDFAESNPRLVYEEEQQELERQRKVAEEIARQERVEYLKHLKTKRIEEYQNLCYYGPDDFDKVQQLIQDGFDIKQDGKIYDLSTLINLGRSLKFIEFLIEAGMKVNEDEIQELERQKKIAEEKVKKKLEDIKKQKKVEEENAIRGAEEYQKRLQNEIIDEFRTIWCNGPDNIERVQKLITYGLDITQPMVSPTLTNLIIRGRSMQFILFLIGVGLKINQADIQYCLKSNSEYNSIKFLEVLIGAKIIDPYARGMATSALKQKEDAQRHILEQENKLAKLKEVTQGKFDSFFNLLKYGDLDDIKQVFNYGFLLANQRIHMNNSEVSYSILSIFESRNIEFVKLLVDAGYCVTKENIDYYYANSSRVPDHKQIVEVLVASNNIDGDAIERVNEIKREYERVCLERIRLEEERKTKEAKEHLERLQKQQIEEFIKMCEYGQDNIFKLKQLMDEGLDITKIANFDCLMSCLECRKRADFIRFLVDSGIQVTNKHIKYCYANTKYFTDPLSLINILENAKNLESEAFEDILKKTKFNVIGTISATCICIFFLFMPQILNREIDNFYYILAGIITILFLLLAISFIVDLRKRLKINNTNHHLDNQLLQPKQAGYERPNAQDKIGIAGSVKEFNHKEIKRRKLILWIVVTLISISTVALIYIYFEEVIAFLKVALILVVIIALFIWRYSPTKRR